MSFHTKGICLQDQDQVSSLRESRTKTPWSVKKSRQSRLVAGPIFSFSDVDKEGTGTVSTANEQRPRREPTYSSPSKPKDKREKVTATPPPSGRWGHPRPLPESKAFGKDTEEHKTISPTAKESSVRNHSQLSRNHRTSKLVCPPTPAPAERVPSWTTNERLSATKLITAFPRTKRGERNGVGDSTSSGAYQILSILGKGSFADVYKVRSRADGCLYALKKKRDPFRGESDREHALHEVRTMQRMQVEAAAGTAGESGRILQYSKHSRHVLFLFRSWQEGGCLFCQTELCCRDTLRDLMNNLRPHGWKDAQDRYPCLGKLSVTRKHIQEDGDSQGRLMPEATLWKICHDVLAGLSHVHESGFVHFDMKPSNVLLTSTQQASHDHGTGGDDGAIVAICKIGDFGMAGEIGSPVEDGREGDSRYMAPEVLMPGTTKHCTADVFSTGLTLLELAAEDLDFCLPSGGQRWHELRDGQQQHRLKEIFGNKIRSPELAQLIGEMIRADPERRPTVAACLNRNRVLAAGQTSDAFLNEYIADTEKFERLQIEKEDEQNDGGGVVTPPYSEPRTWQFAAFGDPESPISWQAARAATVASSPEAAA